MEKDLFTALVSITTAIVGVAILATLVSSKSNTAGVITAAGNAYGNILGIAEGPVTGFTPSGGGIFTGGLTGSNLNLSL